MSDSAFASSYECAAMPVTGVAVDYPNGHVIPAHRHDRAQLLYAIEGVLVIETQAGRWVVPPSRGVWLMAGVDHTVRMRGAARMRSLFINLDAIAGLPQGDCVIEVSPLLRELILAATAVQEHYQSDSREGRIMRLILDELRWLPVLPFNLPWPQEPRMLRVCQTLAADPADNSTAEHWADRLAMSGKTFHRQFQRATGITFGRWRQQARLLLSLECLAQGMPIVQVALQHGYDSQSAFAAAFKRQFGVPPSLFYR
ncbi:helix-turn-helix transcriptional regulator [Pseudomonas sp. TH05]|uniref:AraC family transcriptional regulator n=1 Tax=unclassified Pseudomonas TaxID=196821 RepID=UPI000355076B|nr:MULTISPECIES: helix-turn-helix transcriptional regulator [unclassified Pseudomonas]EPL03328.1 AraC family transcriptional regulator [Pseudomonas sp. CF161]MBK5542175.1 helix-turn-helix transcriptional regulator [Pseudomonas sp. TH07]MBK5559651.1 helix-turn-helix transcriptional regulator [Pseudomonas sp. TH05]OOW00443.1 AraC family transcriptional regulator [Pseudomonas sp. MF4836]